MLFTTGLEGLNKTWADVRLSIRHLWKNPGFTIATVLTLALGIGATTAIFSVVHGVVLAPLPFADPDHLAVIWESNPHTKHVTVSYLDYKDWQRDAHSFQKMAALTWRTHDLTSPGEAAHVNGLGVSSDFFSTLGVRLLLGREFATSEDQRGGAPVAIISNSMWRTRFSANPKVLGKVVVMDGSDYTIIGVLEPEFHFITDNLDIFTPIGQGDRLLLDDRTVHPGITCLVRLRPNVTIAQAQAEMSTIQSHLGELYPEADRDLGTQIVPLKQELVGDVRGTLLLILGAVGLVLLIACANVANLLLAHSAARTREFAIRTALGATRGKIVRQLLTESMLLSLLGGSIGLLVSLLGIRPILAAVPGGLPRAENIGLNLPLLMFALGTSILVGIIFGLTPALKSSKLDLQASLRRGDRGSTGAHSRAQSSLVIAQMAMSIVLLLGAGLLFRTIRHLWNVDPGIDMQHAITLKVGLSPSVIGKPLAIKVAYGQLLGRIREIQGVQSADFTNLVPLSGEDNDVPFWIGSDPPPSIPKAPRMLMFWTGPDYLRAIGIPLLQGRFFSRSDTVQSPPVVVIDSVLAHKYFPGKNPVGQTITVAHWGAARIIGVAGHVQHWGLDRPDWYTQNQVYAPFYQLPDPWVSVMSQNLTIIIRTTLDSETVMSAVKSVVYESDKNMPVYDVHPMREIVSGSMSSHRFPMILLGAFAGLALVLASVGIYGVISYSVTLRMHEIGVRMALGAEKGKIFKMIVGQGLRLAAVGLVIGSGIAIILLRTLSGFTQLLYGVGASDPVTFAAVTTVLATVAFLACYIPALRATKVDPMVALRYD
jgi:predicted permease